MENTPTFVTTSSFLSRNQQINVLRFVWILLTILSSVIFLAGTISNDVAVPECLAQPVAVQATCLTSLLSPAVPPMLLYNLLSLILTIIPSASMVCIGVLIFWHKSNDRVAYLLSLAIVLCGTAGLNQAFSIVAGQLPIFAVPIKFMLFLGYTSAGVIFCLFPDGRFFPRWTRWLLLLWIVRNAIIIFVPGAPYDVESGGLFFLGFMILLGYRFFKTPKSIQRQQMKWIVASLILTGIIQIINFGIYSVVPFSDTTMYMVADLTAIFLVAVSVIILAISFGIAIFRYRLWEIDFLINRGLVYGTLTLLLIALFAGILYISSFVVQGKESLFVFGVASIAAGVSFQPIRRRLQRFVDRRLYNIQIDYEKRPHKLASLPSFENLMPILQNTRLSAYTNLELIGEGGMGQIYKATYPDLAQPVAIKILRPDSVSTASAHKRFLREAEIAKSLKHPNIVRTFDAGEEQNIPYIVMEFVTGVNLERYLREKRCLDLAEAFVMLKDIASALDYAHHQKLVHRDIKPSNIMLELADTSPRSVPMRAVLMDFGIAKLLDTQTDLTTTGRLVGTFQYLSPEQIQSSEEVDGRSDVYSFGVMAYQMFVGELPFAAHSAGQLIFAHLNQPAPDPCQRMPGLPPHVGKAILRALSKSPSERFSTVGEFVTAMYSTAESELSPSLMGFSN